MTTIPASRVVLLLSLILVLAFAVPYAAVTKMHARRLAQADAATERIAGQVAAAIAARSPEIPPGTEVLAGAGERQVALDDRWKSGTSFPLAGVIGERAAQADPWNNAYLVNIGALRTGGRVWVISPGPDGILQTPFAAADGPQGDDRAAQVRVR